MKGILLDNRSFDTLIEIMNTLRGPDGCPWDREQTHASLKPYLIEETYEVLEALDHEDPVHIREELGDLLLQSVFHAQLAKESDQFDIYDVLETIIEKMIRRHPHVFGDVEIHSADEQISHWEKIKFKEGKKSVIDGVPKTAPALLRAYRIQQKAAAVGFDWPQTQPVFDKVQEEFQELLEAIDQQDEANIEEEFGDLLFSLVNLSRFIKKNPEEALRKATNKFIRRFNALEEHYRKDKKDIRNSSLEEMDRIWNTVKKVEKNPL